MNTDAVGAPKGMMAAIDDALHDYAGSRVDDLCRRLLRLRWWSPAREAAERLRFQHREIGALRERTRELETKLAKQSAAFNRVQKRG